MSYGVLIPARENITILRRVLKAVTVQTLRPEQIVLVNDGCEGDVEGLCRSLDIEYHRFPVRHRESWISRPELALVHNFGLRKLDRELEWFMILASDTVLERRYVEKVIREMTKKDLVIASGRIVGEYSNTPRGSGRIYATWFWRKYIGEFPLIYAWESYPLYKAMVMGYGMEIVDDALMYVLRPTRNYKPLYGYAMRELGYHPVYALGRVAVAMIRDSLTALKMLQTYMRGSRCDLEDEYLKEVVKHRQAKVILEYLIHPGRVFKGVS